MIGVDVGVGEVAGLSHVECACTLGIVVLYVGSSIGSVIGTFDSVATLADGVDGLVSVSALSSVYKIFYRTLHDGSPVSRLGAVAEGGSVRMVLISEATCLKKSYKPTFGIGISLEKRDTVSTSFTNLVAWKIKLCTCSAPVRAQWSILLGHVLPTWVYLMVYHDIIL